MAAGASMSHPSVPSIIIAPICPHSLSFRPIVVPATVDLKITLAKDARHTAWFCVDGRANTELKHGYQINITTSEYPLPSICRSDQVMYIYNTFKRVFIDKYLENLIYFCFIILFLVK